MAAQTDLWGEIVPAAVRTPVAILREQAALLGTKTKNLVEARVVTEAHGDAFTHRFQLVAPALENYTYALFTIQRGIDFYPVTVHGQSQALLTEEHFVSWLRMKLSSDSTKRIVGHLIAQITA